MTENESETTATTPDPSQPTASLGIGRRVRRDSMDFALGNNGRLYVRGYDLRLGWVEAMGADVGKARTIIQQALDQALREYPGEASRRMRGTSFPLVLLRERRMRPSYLEVQVYDRRGTRAAVQTAELSEDQLALLTSLGAPPGTAVEIETPGESGEAADAPQPPQGMEGESKSTATVGGPEAARVAEAAARAAQAAAAAAQAMAEAARAAQAAAEAAARAAQAAAEAAGAGSK